MSSASESHAGELLWQQARTDYETTTTDLNAIAQALGISRYRLIAEARKRGWKLRGTGNSSTRATIQRFKDLLQKRLAQLEGEMDAIVAEVSSAASERDIRPVNMLVRTLEKVLELERKDRAARARKRKERRKFDDAARNELASRLTALHRERGSPLCEPAPQTWEVQEVLKDWRNWARPGQQIPPEGNVWRNWLVLGGRGAGKTRSGAEWVKAIALGIWEPMIGRAERIAIVAPTFAEARLVMIEGKSGLLAIHDESERPRFEPSKRQLTWPNGCVAHVFSAEEPDGLRGPQFDAAWCDELAKWKHAGAVWDMLAVGMGGYIGGRSLEKITTQIFGAIPPKGRMK